MPQHDDHDDLSALDFSAHHSDSDDHGLHHSDALDFSFTEDGFEETPADAFDEYAPTEPDDSETELAAIASVTEAEDEEEDEEEGLALFTVTNPPDTVSVSALIDGRTQRVTLSPKVTNMTESELAEEVLVLADLARQKGLAGQRTFLQEDQTVTESLDQLGIADTDVIREFMDAVYPLPTAEQADMAQAEVFAARYTNDETDK
ncbi:MULTISPECIES: hypothetical protein [unclassified Mycobacterium]|uniref:hypothetical protein n=1 Tax=unclassified Mycobacterium TaxID=2642494 RepID=UPI0007FBEAE6|nr:MULTISPECIES: hypothetical protein [unclassified Mycobacterium]OBH21282.1 hypothetical protein A9X04_05660 [Mycobacterium sp. E3247]OBI22867.1 hypothetical protein A5713_10315 [Mycobacterium sp. E2497]